MKMDFPKPVALIENIKQTDARDGHMDEIEIPILQWMEPGEIEEDPLEISKIEQVMVKEEFVEQNETLFEENDGLTTPNKISIKAVKTNGTAKNEFDERNEFLYMCCDCSFSTDTQGKLQQHTISSHLSQLIKKKMNENISYSKMKNNPKTNKLNKPTELQINSIRKEQQFACNLCNFSSSYARKLTRHIITSHKKNQWSCQFCNFISCSRFVLEEHISQSHSHASIKQENSKSGIELVDKMYITQREFNKFIYMCSACKFSTDMKENLQRHTLRIHLSHLITEKMREHINYSKIKHFCYMKVNAKNNKKDKKIERLYACNLCEFESPLARRLTQHIITSHKKNEWSCHLCNFISCSITVLRKHISEQHSYPSIMAGIKTEMKVEDKGNIEIPNEISLEHGIKTEVDDELIMDHCKNVKIPSEINMVEGAKTNIRKKFDHCKDEPGCSVNNFH